MDNLIEVLKSIFKDNFILKNKSNKIIFPNSDEKIAYYKKLDTSPNNIFNTKYDVENKKFYNKKIIKMHYQKEQYTLIIYEDKTNEVKGYKDREFELYIDNLTNIYRREMTYIKADKYIKYAINNKESFTIIMIDIDNFKNINDTYGHLKGDLVLKFIAKELFYGTRHRSDNDIIGRIGGDEFFILLKNIDENDIDDRLNELNNNICNDKMQQKFKEKITCSFGAYRSE